MKWPSNLLNIFAQQPVNTFFNDASDNFFNANPGLLSSAIRLHPSRDTKVFGSKTPVAIALARDVPCS